ncbi:MAG: signal peptidase I [Chloroflexi bacterium]|nr:signal peptidase I [Chloroflexota bacterium]
MLSLDRRYQIVALEVLETVLLALFIFFATRLVMQNFRVQGPSMHPNLISNELVLVSKLSYINSSPERGDVVVFRKPGGDSEDLVKRIVGMPGETIEMRTGRVFVNGLEIEETGYVDRLGTAVVPPVRIPAGSYFVLGDNRSVSEDSRRFGAVPLAAIVGKVWVIYWPFAKFGFFPEHSPTLIPAPVRSLGPAEDRPAA